MEHGVLKEIAGQFVVARRSGVPLDSAALDGPAWTIDDAYTVQEISAALSGAQVAGYKIGLTSPGAQQSMAATAPIAGYLDRGRILHSPARAAVSRHLRVVEAEVVVVIGQDLLPRHSPFTQADLAGVISAPHAGIEICNSRFVSDEVPLPYLVADNGFADLMVIGDRLDVPVDALHQLTVRLQRSRGADIDGATDRIDGGPLAAVTWLANHLAERGRHLRAGQIVATGSCTGITILDADEGVVATFTYQEAVRGSASFTFEQDLQEGSV